MHNPNKLSQEVSQHLEDARGSFPKLHFDTLMPLLIAKKSANRYKKSKNNKIKKPGDEFSPLLINSTDKLKEILDWTGKQMALNKDVKLNIPIIFDDGEHHLAIELIVEEGNQKLILLDSLVIKMRKKEKPFSKKEIMELLKKNDNNLENDNIEDSDSSTSDSDNSDNDNDNETEKLIEYFKTINNNIEILQKPITQIQQKDNIVCSALSLNNLADMSRLTTNEKLIDCIPLFDKSGELIDIDKHFSEENLQKINPHFIKNVQSVSFNSSFFKKNNASFKSNTGDLRDSEKHIKSRYNISFVTDKNSPVGRFKLTNSSIAKKREGYLQEIDKINKSIPEDLLQEVLTEQKKIDDDRLSRYIDGNHSTLESTKKITDYDLELSNKDKLLIVPVDKNFLITHESLNNFYKGIFVFTNLVQEHAKYKNKISFEEFLNQSGIDIKSVVDKISSELDATSLLLMEATLKEFDLDSKKINNCFEIFLKMLPAKELIEYISINEEAFTWLLQQDQKLSSSFSDIVSIHLKNPNLKADDTSKLNGILKNLIDVEQTNKLGKPKT